MDANISNRLANAPVGCRHKLRKVNTQGKHAYAPWASTPKSAGGSPSSKAGNFSSYHKEVKGLARKRSAMTARAANAINGTIKSDEKVTSSQEDSAISVDWSGDIKNTTLVGNMPQPEVQAHVREIRTTRVIHQPESMDWGCLRLPNMRPYISNERVRLARACRVQEPARGLDWGVDDTPKKFPADAVDIKAIYWGVDAMPQRLPSDPLDITPVDWSAGGAPIASPNRLAFLCRVMRGMRRVPALAGALVGCLLR